MRIKFLLLILLTFNVCASVKTVPLNLSLIPCEGKYALCFYAKCKMNNDGTAECGCVMYDTDDAISFVDVNNIYPEDLHKATLDKCPYGLASCPHPGQAPICQNIGKALTSTFNVGIPEFSFHGTLSCGKGKFANCMTAPCEAKEAFDGSPVSCTCRVQEGEFAIAKGGSCSLGEGIVWSATFVPK